MEQWVSSSRWIQNNQHNYFLNLILAHLIGPIKHGIEYNYFPAFEWNNVWIDYIPIG